MNEYLIIGHLNIARDALHIVEQATAAANCQIDIDLIERDLDPGELPDWAKEIRQRIRAIHDQAVALREAIPGIRQSVIIPKMQSQKGVEA
jgi:hypothetical protein